MNKLNINMLNMKKKKKDDYYIFKIDNYKELNDYKILINSDEDKIIQLKLNYKLIKKITIKYKDTEKVYDKLSHNCILINFETNKDTILEIIVYPLDLTTRINLWDIKIIEKKEQQIIKWDKVYIINLKRRNDRKILMIEKLSEEKIDNYEFIEAYDGKDEEIINDYNLLKNYTQITNSCHFGCLLIYLNL